MHWKHYQMEKSLCYRFQLSVLTYRPRKHIYIRLVDQISFSAQFSDLRFFFKPPFSLLYDEYTLLFRILCLPKVFSAHASIRVRNAPFSIIGTHSFQYCIQCTFIYDGGQKCIICTERHCRTNAVLITYWKIKRMITGRCGKMRDFGES